MSSLSQLTLLYNVNKLSVVIMDTNSPTSVVAYGNGDITQLNTTGGQIKLLSELLQITVAIELRSVERNGKSYQEETYTLIFNTDTLTVATINWTFNYIQNIGGGITTTVPYLQGYVGAGTGGFFDWENQSVTIQYDNVTGNRLVTILGPPSPTPPTPPTTS